MQRPLVFLATLRSVRMFNFSLFMPPIETVQVMLISTGAFALVVMWIKILQSALDVILGEALV